METVRHKTDQNIPLNFILSTELKAQVNGQIEAFLKGINYRKVSRKEYTLTWGYVRMPYEATQDDETAELIKEIICEYYRMPSDKLIYKTRKREIVHARKMFQTMLKEFTLLTLEQIGERTGGFKHDTVLSSLRSIGNLCETDKKVKVEYDELISIIKSKTK